MPKDERSNPRKVPVLAIDDADDDVIDLLEVVKPGRNLKGDGGGDDGDFSADLDAMLDGLSEGGAEDETPDIPDHPAPFPDPTPVDHKVDHNETLDLPGMDDLDKLLKSFGAPGADNGKEETEESDFLDTDPDMPDLDALPVPPAASPKASAPAAPGGIEKAPPAKAAAKPAPAPEEDELLASLLANAPAPPAAGKNEKAAPAPAGGTDEDLFAELDLALDSPPPDDAPSLDDALSAGGDAAPEPAPVEKEAASVENQPGDPGLPPLDTDEEVPAGAEWSDLDDLDLDALGLEEEKPETGTGTSPATEPWPAESPVEADPENIFDLALVDGGPEGRAMDVFVGAEQTAGVEAAADEAAGDGPRRLEDTSPGTAAPEAGFLDLDEESSPDVQEDDPGPEVARLFGRDAAGGSSAPDKEGGPDLEDSAPPALPETGAPESRATAPPDTGNKADLSPHEAAAEEQARASRFDEVDLNELDALLDDMLATAPASGPSPAAAVAANGQADSADTPAASKSTPPAQAATLFDTDAAPVFPEVEAVQSRLAGQEDAIKDIRDQLAGQDAVLEEQRDMARVLREDMDALSADAERQRTRLAGQEAEIRELDRRLSELGDKMPVSDQAAESDATDTSGSRLDEHGGEAQEQAQDASRFNEEVKQLEQRLSEHAEEMQDLIQRFSSSCDLIQVVEQRLDALGAGAGTGSDPRLEALAGKVDLLEARLAERSARCEALEARLESLLANMDKLAAETAAKVIREELAALMESMA